MTLDELVTEAREQWLSDTSDAATVPAGVSLDTWTDATLLRFAIEAQQQACRHGDCTLLFDSTTEAVCSITLVEDQLVYPLNALILRLQRVLMGGNIELGKETPESFDITRPGWRVSESGTPTACFVMGRNLVLDRAPTAAAVTEHGTLNLEVYRLPIGSLVGTDELEISTIYQPFLAHWMCYRALSRRDEDLVNYGGMTAKQHLQTFEQEFGRRNDVPQLQYLIESAGYLHQTPTRDYHDGYKSSNSDWIRDLG